MSMDPCMYSCFLQDIYKMLVLQLGPDIVGEFEDIHCLQKALCFQVEEWIR